MGPPIFQPPMRHLTLAPDDKYRPQAASATPNGVPRRACLGFGACVLGFGMGVRDRVWMWRFKSSGISILEFGVGTRGQDILKRGNCRWTMKPGRNSMDNDIQLLNLWHGAPA